MSLGLPSHLARKANSRALAGASRVGGLTALGLAAVCVLVPGVSLPGGPAPMVIVPVIGVVAVAVLAAMFVVPVRRRSVSFMVATLIVGVASTFLYALTILIQNPLYPNTGLFVFALPVIALTFIGGTGSGSLTGVIWATIGYALAEVSIFAATIVTTRDFSLGGAALGAYLLVAAVLTLDGLTRNLKRGAQGNILRALRLEQAAAVQKTVAADAAADLHDTVLSQLAMLAQTSPGPLSPRLRERIEDSLASWGRDRAAELERDAAHARTVDELWIESGLASAVEQARDQGLTITISGDRSAFARLNADRRHAAALAVRQCLVNVLLHSGQAAAEIALSSDANEVSIMIVDAGRGFDESQLPDDRMGIRRSIRERVERVGGRVSVFSRPGAGTSIALVLPGADAGADAVGGAVGGAGADAAGSAGAGGGGGAVGGAGEDAAGGARADARGGAAGEARTGARGNARGDAATYPSGRAHSSEAADETYPADETHPADETDGTTA
ncbi:MAG: ATP-binding protein [Microbacteriaceae bacterium]